MLDKSVPYVGLYMKRPAGAPIAKSPLPDGFRFAFFKSGDEQDWARIETSVLEFNSEFAALMHIKEYFIPFIEELEKRCIFIENENGDKVATSTAWWHEVEGERRAWLHWVAVDPHYQGLGLGKALTSRVTELMIELEGDVDFYLHTQTWSYKAVNIYMANGYQLTDEKVLYRDPRSSYKKAKRILMSKGLVFDIVL